VIGTKSASLHIGGSVRLAEAELITKGDTGCPGSGRPPSRRRASSASKAPA